jgi:hypothetical protein
MITTLALVKLGHYNIQNRRKREEGVTVAPIPIGNWYRVIPLTKVVNFGKGDD